MADMPRHPKRCFVRTNMLAFASTPETELHLLSHEKREVARILVETYNLPFSIVAEYRHDHPLLGQVEPFVLENSTKNGTLDILMNAGALHNAIARMSAERERLVFGSSANRSLTGSKYRL